MRGPGGLVALALGSALALGCGSEAPTKPGRSAAGVITTATFARVVDDKARVAEGLDVDGVDTESADLASCSKTDYTSPEGWKGIDNQFGALLPVIESYVGSENIGQLLATAIANGQLLIVLEIDGLDDPANDDDVSIRMGAGVGAPMLDSQGKFIEYQTFGLDRKTAPVSVVEHGHITGGLLEIGPGEGVLPVRVLDADFNLALHGLKGRIEVTPDSSGGGVKMKGIFAGGLAVADFKDIIGKLNIGSDVIQTATTVVGVMADLARDDEKNACLQLSAGLSFESTPAFLLDP